MWAAFKRWVWEWRGVWIATPSVAAFVILLRFSGLLQSWEWAVYDQYLRRRPIEPRDQRIAIVGIDELDIRETVRQGIIPDQDLAELLEKLKVMQPRAIGLDLYRDLPVEPGHDQLVALYNSTPNLVGIQKVIGSQPWEIVAPPPELKAKDQVGANDLIVDPDGKVRRFLLYTMIHKKQIYSFALTLVSTYLKQEQIHSPTALGNNKLLWGKTILQPLQAYDGGYVRADVGGYQMLLNYRGGNRHFETVSMTDLLENRVPPDWGRDRIILIGKIGESFKDLLYTPYSSGLLSLPKPMAGVEVHANITSQILSSVLDGRPQLKSWSEPIEWLWIFLWAGIGSVATWKLRYTSNLSSFSSWFGITVCILAGGALLGSTYIGLLHGLWIPAVPSLLALLGSGIAVTAHTALTAGEIRKTFGRYLSAQVVANLLENPEGLKMGGERRKLTILTSDLRGFTATSERLPPEEVIKILNFYLEYMADVITHYEGTIDEFMGDGILVLFGAPTAKVDDAERAVACAIAMQLAIVPVNEKMKEWGLPPLEMGIGINTGEVVVGNIGSEKRTKYGVVGSQVNLTYRIESYTVGGQIFLSESTFKEVRSLVKINIEKQVQPKGVKELITIYDVGGIGGRYNLSLPKQEEEFFNLTEEISLHYRILDGKDVGDRMVKGYLVKLSAKGGVVRCYPEDLEFMPPPDTNIKLNLFTPGNSLEPSEDVYAKVLHNGEEKSHFYIWFTAKPPDVDAELSAIYQKIIIKN